MTDTRNPEQLIAAIEAAAGNGAGWLLGSEGVGILVAAYRAAKAKKIARGKLMERFRCHLQEVCDHAQDEGDRAYFGSTNHLDYLREIVLEMDMWNWDAITRERGKTDPYAECRELRARAETAEAERDELAKALRPFAAIAGRYDGIPGIHRINDDVELWQIQENKGMRVDITVGDLRAARATLTRMETSNASE